MCRKLHGQLLDVGGYDGAIALFLTGFRIDLIDPETMGGTATAIPASDRAYEVVTVIDALEHIDPDDRETALVECVRVTRNLLVLNYPCRESAPGQQLMLKLTGNPLVKQHVEWDLTDTDWITKRLRKLGFEAKVIPHTNVAIWLGQYIVQSLLPDVAVELNRALVEKHTQEPFQIPLYHLVVAERVLIDDKAVDKSE